ncbi:hypothetical protein DL766_000885 [Monosporascus sp. MC13-8B]|nr:hypothetical protein DL763_004147 [Monosporascus cannonballus]RYP38675.1 hypothetical protein DL766_000885 [Monosporascus sp. MC13-8B]
MTLADAYKQFLAAPDASLLASDASLYYVTTTTSFKGASEIISHVIASRGKFKKVKEAFLHAVQGQGALAVEVDTTLKFLTSGGPYLPGLDDNFLADHTVHVLVTHFVSFDGQGKVLQIRQTWDQGSLLKQLDVIGKTGRNWPIRDSREQIKMIETCVKSVSGVAGVATGQDSADLAVRSRGDSAGTTCDPNARLSLFASHEEKDEAIPSVISPRGGIRPHQRSFTEILGDEPAEDPASPSAGRQPESPRKVIAPKAGAGKNYQPSRLFAAEELDDEKYQSDDGRSPDRFVRPNPKRYEHFDFADGSDPQDASRPGEPSFRKPKHSSQWDFSDFVTPHKAKPSKGLRQQDMRHWGAANDEMYETPPRKPAPGKPRRDAETHFEFVDDGFPRGEPHGARPRGATHNSGLGLYKNNLYDEENGNAAPVGNSRPLSTITNTKDRGRDFQPHFAMTDQSPGQETQPHPAVGEDGRKDVKMMDASWLAYDSSPAQKENQRSLSRNGTKASEDRGIHIAGDGMGGGKGSNRDWLFGADDDDSHVAKPAPGRKAGTAAKSESSNWDF